MTDEMKVGGKVFLKKKNTRMMAEKNRENACAIKALWMRLVFLSAQLEWLKFSWEVSLGLFVFVFV